jgi:hypothetical protein
MNFWDALRFDPFSMPPPLLQPLADAITEAFALMRSDTAGFRTDTVEQLLGRKPVSFANWCIRNAVPSNIEASPPVCFLSLSFRAK